MNWFQELTNILKCKALQLTGQLKYPLSILPRKNYVPRIDIDALCKEMTIFIIRRSQKTGTELFNKFGKLREDALSETDVINMSMNLLGGAFRTEYIEFNPTKEATRNWNGIEPIFYSKYHTLVQTLPHATPIFFNVLDLHDKNIPYQRSKDKEVNKLMAKLNIKPLETDGKYALNARSIINAIKLLAR
jgi:hypothetical protein